MLYCLTAAVRSNPVVPLCRVNKTLQSHMELADEHEVLQEEHEAVYRQLEELLAEQERQALHEVTSELLTVCLVHCIAWPCLSYLYHNSVMHGPGDNAKTGLSQHASMQYSS